jgi:chromosome segregation ATPase
MWMNREITIPGWETREYLDKEKLLKEIKNWNSNGEELDWLKIRINQGEFDVKQAGACIYDSDCRRAVTTEVSRIVSTKDAEIARLQKHFDDAQGEIQQLQREGVQFKDRIADLEKLSTMQKATIDAQGEELHQKQIALANLQDLVNPQRRSCLTCENTKCDVLICADQTCWTPAQKKEPGLFICPNIGCKPACSICPASTPHPKDDCCDYSGTGGCAKCIPYKEPTQTPAPEEGKSPIQHLQDRVLELEQHCGRDRADLMEKIRGLETEISEVKWYAEQSYLERKQNADVARDVSNRQACEILKMRDQINELQTDLKSLKDKTSRELSQAFAEVNRVLAEHREMGDASRDRIDILDSDLAAVMRAALKQKDQIEGLEHRIGLAQDRIVDIHPGGCVPPVKSKLKSRLKTDRAAKKVSR